MPFKTEHAARIQTTSGVTNIRRVKGLDDGVSAIVGTKDGKGVEVSIRFDKTKFSETRAKKWLEDNNYKPIKFEPAISGQGDMSMPYHDDDKKMEDKEKDNQINNPFTPDKYAAEDLYRKQEDALEKAKEMGLENTHSHIHVIDEEEVTLYMPGRDHDEYMKAKAEMQEKENEAHDEKEKDMGSHKDDEKEMGAHDKEEKKDNEAHKDDKKKDMGAHDEDEEEEKKKKNSRCY